MGNGLAEGVAVGSRCYLGIAILTCRTGKHTVADLHCASCDAEVGWMYIKAPNGEQRYKEGKKGVCGVWLTLYRPLHFRRGADCQGECLVIVLAEVPERRKGLYSTVLLCSHVVM